jgi:hypothetical protein
MQTILEAARNYLKRGWQPIPVPFQSKKPVLKDWPNLRVTEVDFAKHFAGGLQNIGLLLGEPSNGLVDVDLDAPEAVLLADAFLPKTGMAHGRQSRPRSHLWYVCAAIPKSQKFTDVDGVVLVELRSTGQQTIVPPSVHPSGESITWDGPCESSVVDSEALIAQVRVLAACCLIARHWPREGSRHEAALALAGGLLRSGWAIEDAEHFVACAARVAGDEESSDRARAVRDTADSLSKNAHVTGWTRLGELVGQATVQRLHEFLSIPRVRETSAAVDTRPWPQPLAAEAMHGLAGEVVKSIEPFSEADRAALLIHFLSSFGAAVGSGPHVWAGDARHTLRIWANLVGKTSKGRKGSAWAPNRRLFSFADPSIVGDRLVHGLSSGEGLIWAVRDPIEKYERCGRGADRSRQLEVVDPGITDKRLLVLEEEFAAVLQVVQREGNTLSAIARCAWDHGNLQSLTKNSPAKATGAHIVCSGHISRDELLRYLDRTEIASGFANRFIWLCTRRARELPEGGSIPEVILGALAQMVSRALEGARRIGQMQRDDAAREIWNGIYGPLSGERPGLLGAMTARAEAQVLRLSMVYAALDGSPLIRKEHLLAGLAVWAYAEQSVAWIFGDSLGDPLADEILRALRTEGPLPRNDIYQRWGRHRGVEQIERALGLLHEYGKVRVERRATAGRPVEIWSAL